MKTLLSRGITYGVSGMPHLNEVVVSGKSAKQWMPDIPIELHIDRETYEAARKVFDLNGLFDFITPYDDVKHERTLKFGALQNSRFEKTLYLDTDTFITDRVDELFEMLDRFDLAVTHAPQRLQYNMVKKGVYEFLGNPPASFPEFNGGVIPFRKNSRTDQFMQDWRSLYDQLKEKIGACMDQQPFRVALFNSDLNFFVLTPEYNLRAMVPNVVKDKVKIIHAHGELESIAKHVNKNVGEIRSYRALECLIYGYTPKGYK